MSAMDFHAMAPALLLAAPRLGDPNFDHGVVLLGRHEPEGALGWVLNGASLAPVGELLKGADLVPAGSRVPGSRGFFRPARLGGPVSPQSGWLLYRRADRSFENEIDVGPDLAVCNDPEALHAILRGEPPEDFRLLLGYAGWGPGQLEGELREGAWLAGEVDAALVLSTDPAALYDAAFERATGTTPAQFNSRTFGSA
jgi:putative transcriptional regulator